MLKIIEALIVLLLALTLTVGFSYLLGGDFPHFESSVITNGLTLLIAIANILSAVVAGFTLYVLITFRHDWLKPKGNDVILDLRLAVKSWFDIREDLNRGIYDGEFSSFELACYGDDEALSKHYYTLKSIATSEREHWLNLALLLEKYSFYYPSHNIELIQSIKDTRKDLNFHTTAFFTKIEDLNSISELSKIKRNKNQEYNDVQKIVDSFLDLLVISN